MSIIDKLTKEAESHYTKTGKMSKKLYLDIEAYATFNKEVREKYSYFFAMNGDKDPLSFNGMEIIKVNNWRIE